jgi:hypothetical protein
VIHAILNFIIRHWEFFASTLIALIGISAYGVYTRSKDHLILDINNALQDCRTLESWDDRSELKLCSWIDGDPRDLHKRSLMHLRKIRKDINRYYQIHEEMRDGEPFGTYQSNSF